MCLVEEAMSSSKHFSSRMFLFAIDAANVSQT
jgi:hypothetical protein